MKPRKVDKPLVLYGMGKLGKLALEIFTELGVDVFAGIDRDMPFNFHASAREKCLIAVCIASEPYGPIAKHLQDVGWPDVVPVWDILEAYADKTGLHNGWMAEEITHEDSFNMGEVLLQLDDDSVAHYRHFLGWRRYHQEWPLEGVFWHPPLPSTLADIRARQEPYRILSGNCDKIDIHNEGHELQTLEWSISELKKYRPEISVTCYHSRDGLWKIPKFLMDNLKNYRFKFRLRAYQGQGAYIYCYPRA